MASTLLYTLVCFTTIIALGSCQNLSCYDCDPSHFRADCDDPTKKLVRLAPCVPDIEGQTTSVCLSAYINVTGRDENLTGIYRGCKTVRPDVADFCDWFKQETNGPNITVISCNTCNSTACNKGKFKDDGTSSAVTVSTTLFVLVLNTIFALLLTVFE